MTYPSTITITITDDHIDDEGESCICLTVNGRIHATYPYEDSSEMVHQILNARRECDQRYHGAPVHESL